MKARGVHLQYSFETDGQRGAALHNQYGVPTQILTADAAREVVPQLTMKGVKAAAWNPKDAVIFPWPFLWGYAQQAQKKGVQVETFTDVVGFELGGGKVKKVITSRGDISCETVVLASGAWVSSVSSMIPKLATSGRWNW